MRTKNLSSGTITKNLSSDTMFGVLIEDDNKSTIISQKRGTETIIIDQNDHDDGGDTQTIIINRDLLFDALISIGMQENCEETDEDS